MKILIAAASFSPHISGLQRHALNLARCVLQQPDISAVHFILAPWQRELLHAVHLHRDSRLTIHIAKMDPTSLRRNLWYYRQLPALAASLKADLVHLTFPVPVNAAAFACPTVVTLHDLYPYEIPLNFGFPKFIFNRLILRQCLLNVDAIACVSEATRARLRQYAPPSTWRKAVRIYNCVEAEPLRTIDTPIPGWRREPFLLCVAQHRRNKNIPLLIRILNRLLRRSQIDPEVKLVVIGIAGPETRAIRRLATSLGLSRQVHFLHGLSEPELQWCYAHCEALIAPSVTEGFGLPIAEALLAGCRVVCSDIPAHREVGDGHCRFVALRKNAEEAFATAIASTLREPRKAPISLPEFSAPLLATQYVGLYLSLVASAACSRNVGFSTFLPAVASERQFPRNVAECGSAFEYGEDEHGLT